MLTMRKYHDEKTMKKNKLPTVPADAVAASLTTIQEITKDVTSYLKIAEEQQTRRSEITAQKEVALESIRARRDTIMKLMEYTYAERAAVLNKQFDALDRALASGDAQLAIQSMSAMTDLVKTSPLKALQDVKLSLENGSIDL